ncbi:STAS domain-containing protein [Streptomyces sp. CRN 30]|uniref:STAS domain-containing protein n=1 Tax=Streptomyces sp. CRN 30 TaxID=3075613 RepID=UPI002A80E1A6|nr:STAS domain-containing protein [Streptomyces sp. CRN 30]
MTDTLRLSVQHPGPGLAVATVVGDVDLHTAPVLRADALQLIEQGTPRLIFDLAQVDYFDSTGLSVLIGIWHAAQEAGGSLTLAAVPGRLSRMLSLTGVDALLRVHTTLEEALADLGGDAGAGVGAG